MTITRAASGSTSGSAVSTLTVSMSASPTAGNLLLAGVYSGNTQSSSTMNTPTGWTKYWGIGGTSGTNLNACVIYYRIVQAGDGTSWTFSGTGATTFMAAYAAEYNNSNGAWSAIDDQHGDSGTQGTGVITIQVTATGANTQATDWGWAISGANGTVTSWSWGGTGGFTDGGVNVGSRFAIATKDMSAIETSTVTPTANGSTGFIRCTLGTFKQPTGGAAAGPNPDIRQILRVPIIRASNF